MTEWKTLRVPEWAYDEAQEARGENETWGDYLVRCSNEPRIEMSEAELEEIIRERIEDMVVDQALRH